MKKIINEGLPPLFSIETSKIKKMKVLKNAYAAQVLQVHDGDTFTALNADGFKVIYRLANIDAPEIKQPTGVACKVELIRLLASAQNKIMVYDQSHDNYGRIVAKVNITAGDVSRLMVQSGHAFVFDKYNRDATIKPLEKAAQMANLFIWKEKEIHPDLFRKSQKKQTS